MNETCRNVLDQIELYTAGECAEPERTLISRHLAACSACAQSERETTQLLGLLDTRFEEPERLRRLHARLDSELRAAPRRRVLAFARRASAVAALLLLAFGLTLGFRVFAPSDAEVPLEVALGRSSFRLAPPAPAIDPAPERLHGRGQFFFTAPFQRELKEDIAAGGRPAPPQVNLQLQLRNRGSRALRILVGAEGSELWLRLSGPGALTVPAKNPLDAAFLVPTTVTLAPGETTSLPIERLVFGSRDNIRYAYWTEPGEYELSIRYRAVVAPDMRQVTLESASIRIQVNAVK